MKLQTLIYGSLLSAVVISCTEEPTTKEPTVEDLSSYALQYLNKQQGSAKALNESGDAAISQTFETAMYDMAGGDDTTYVEEPDSTIVEEPWVSCATVTETINEDGSVTTVYDYGTGCEERWGEYTYQMSGKFTQNYKYVTTIEGSVYTYAYSFNMVYDNYGGSYDWDSTEWFTEGYSNYEGVSHYDTVTYAFSGTNEFNDNVSYGYNGTVGSYKSVGKSSYNEAGSIVEESEYEYGDGDNYYKSKVTVPLVMDYSCSGGFEESVSSGRVNGRMDLRVANVWTNVSGHEEISYRQDGVEGIFEIDYGNGECDNLIYITENGITVEVDLGIDGGMKAYID